MIALLTLKSQALVTVKPSRLGTLNRAEQCAVLDKLMPIAHRYGVQMRCCGDKGLVGYPITKSGSASFRQRSTPVFGMVVGPCGTGTCS